MIYKTKDLCTELGLPPHQIEAIRWKYNNESEIAEWTEKEKVTYYRQSHPPYLVIYTPEQKRFGVNLGDWIVKRDGKFFSLSSIIIEKIFEPLIL